MFCFYSDKYDKNSKVCAEIFVINYVVKNVAQGWTYVKFRTILKISVCP